MPCWSRGDNFGYWLNFCMRKQEQDNPLPGYIDEYWTDANYLVFRDHYVLMLRACHSKKALDLTASIEQDGTFVPNCDSRVFSLNEMAFEVRAAYRKTTPEEENAIRDMWVKRIVKDHGSDAGLDFLIYLKASRKKRDDHFFKEQSREGYGYTD
jgi:hypothetical protein